MLPPSSPTRDGMRLAIPCINSLSLSLTPCLQSLSSERRVLRSLDLATRVSLPPSFISHDTWWTAKNTLASEAEQRLQAAWLSDQTRNEE